MAHQLYKGGVESLVRAVTAPMNPSLKLYEDVLVETVRREDRVVLVETVSRIT